MGACIYKDKLQPQESELRTATIKPISCSIPQSDALDLTRSPSFKFASQNKYASLKDILLPNQETSVPSLTLKEENSNEEIPERNKSKVTTIVTQNQYTISIFETANQNIQPAEVYYQQDKSPITRKKSATVMPRTLLPQITEEETELESKVTKSIREGEGFEKVEKAFSKYLRKDSK